MMARRVRVSPGSARWRRPAGPARAVRRARRPLLAVVALVCAALPSQAGAAAWGLQAPAIPQVPNGQLAAVNCTSTSACTAVGDFTNGSGTQVTLAERWNGTSWSTQATPAPTGATAAQLSAVRCPSSTSCVAVGFYDDNSGNRLTLAQRWNGTSWSNQSTPNPAG